MGEPFCFLLKRSEPQHHRSIMSRGGNVWGKIDQNYPAKQISSAERGGVLFRDKM
jgi:hypothetical protein